MGTPTLKSPEEIEAMRPAGRLVAKALALVGEMVRPGVTTAALDKAVEDLFRKAGGMPLFKGYPSPSAGVADFPSTICASINEEVVHGIPSERTLQEGDILSVDVGVKLDGWCGDAARSFPVGEITRKARKLLRVTEACLAKAVEALHPGVLLKEVSGAIQQQAESNGFAVVRKFVGHGIGRQMHEAPQVPNYVARSFRDGRLALDAGTVLAIEPMVNIGKSDVHVQRNGWTVVTKDHSLSAHFENTVAITPHGTEVLTAD